MAKRAIARKSTTRRTKTVKRATRASRTTYVVFGLVRDKRSHLPIRRALVKIVGADAPANFGKEARTNILGLYVMTSVLPGRILIEASATGHTVVEKSKTITGHTNINFDL